MNAYLIITTNILLLFITTLTTVVCSRDYYIWENSTFVTKALQSQEEPKSKESVPYKSEFKGHSQSGQDSFVVKLLGDRSSNGFFIDLASNHWELISNTNSLEKYYNWTG
jgi:hypothetical protein